jgi:hypothetical protein
MSRGILLPSLNSQSLSNTLKKVKPCLENYKAQLDNLTSDIKEVENFIRASGVAQSFYCTVVYWMENPEENIGLAPKSQGRFWDILSWERHEESKSFRLMHSLWYEDHYENQDVVFSKPLLESSVNTRKRVFPYLNKFIEELSSAISVPETSSINIFSESDIPF